MSFDIQFRTGEDTKAYKVDLYFLRQHPGLSGKLLLSFCHELRTHEYPVTFFVSNGFGVELDLIEIPSGTGEITTTRINIRHEAYLNDPSLSVQS